MLIYVKYFLLSAFFFANFNCVIAQSPYKLDAAKDAVVISSGIAVGLPAIIINSNLDAPTPDFINSLDKNNINSFDRFAVNYYSEALADASDILLYASVAAPALFAISPDIRRDALTVGTMYAETMLFAAALPYLAKGLVQRTRPFAYNPDAPMQTKLDPETSRSFFSGHTTVAFASAVFLSSVYSAYYPGSKFTPYIWGGSLLVASSVAALRVFSGKHFPTDVITGAVVGSAVGWLIPKIHAVSRSDNFSLSTGIFSLSFAYKF